MGCTDRRAATGRPQSLTGTRDSYLDSTSGSRFRGTLYTKTGPASLPGTSLLEASDPSRRQGLCLPQGTVHFPGKLLGSSSLLPGSEAGPGYGHLLTASIPSAATAGDQAGVVQSFPSAPGAPAWALPARPPERGGLCSGLRWPWAMGSMPLLDPWSSLCSEIAALLHASLLGTVSIPLLFSPGEETPPPDQAGPPAPEDPTAKCWEAGKDSVCARLPWDLHSQCHLQCQHSLQGKSKGRSQGLPWLVVSVRWGPGWPLPRGGLSSLGGAKARAAAAGRAVLTSVRDVVAVRPVLLGLKGNWGENRNSEGSRPERGEVESARPGTGAAVAHASCLTAACVLCSSGPSLLRVFSVFILDTLYLTLMKEWV